MRAKLTTYYLYDDFFLIFKHSIYSLNLDLENIIFFMRIKMRLRIAKFPSFCYHLSSFDLISVKILMYITLKHRAVFKRTVNIP